MTSFTSRYGIPAADCRGARIRAHRRHGSVVVTVSGRIDGGNVAAVGNHVVRFVVADSPLVLDLSAVTMFSSEAAELLESVDASCAAAGVEWALVPGEATAGRMRGRHGAADLPVVGTVAEAEHQFDEAILKRRRMLLPLFRKSA